MMRLCITVFYKCNKCNNKSLNTKGISAHDLKDLIDVNMAVDMVTID